jgi:hypothetical protein
MKHNRKIWVFALLVGVWITLIACGLPIPGIPGGSASTPWADVPAFPGATQNPDEALVTSLANQAQSDSKSKVETVILHTDKIPSDIAAFYNDEMMKSKGWGLGLDGTSDKACTQDKLEGQPRAICLYVKKDADGRGITLDILADADPNGGNNTRIVLIRTAESLQTQ